MDSLESNIKDCISKELEKGIVEKVISEKLEECVSKALSNMFGYCGEVKEVIEDKIKSVMIPYIEGYDYSKYIVKLDSVLVDVLKATSLENKKILENFKNLMVPTDKEVFKISDMFKAWTKYCEKEIDKDKLEYYDGYSCINTTVNVEEVSNDWSDIKRYMVAFECEEDEELKFEFPISCWPKYDGNKCNSDYKNGINLNSLRYLNDFEILILKISQVYNGIELDIDWDLEETSIEEEY